MRLVTVKLWIAAIATCVGILFVVLTDLLPGRAPMLLGIEVLVLPTIYIVGNIVAEQKIEEEYATTIDAMTYQMSVLNDKYYKERTRYLALKARHETEVHNGETHE